MEITTSSVPSHHRHSAVVAIVQKSDDDDNESFDVHTSLDDDDNAVVVIVSFCVASSDISRERRYKSDVVENFSVVIVNRDVDFDKCAHVVTFFVRIYAHIGVKNIVSIHPVDHRK